MDAGFDALAWLQAGEGVLGLQVRFGAAFKPCRCVGAEKGASAAFCSQYGLPKMGSMAYSLYGFDGAMLSL